jgi:hypothetical protein
LPDDTVSRDNGGVSGPDYSGSALSAGNSQAHSAPALVLGFQQITQLSVTPFRRLLFLIVVFRLFTSLHARGYTSSNKSIPQYECAVKKRNEKSAGLPWRFSPRRLK